MPNFTIENLRPLIYLVIMASLYYFMPQMTEIPDKISYFTLRETVFFWSFVAMNVFGLMYISGSQNKLVLVIFVLLMGLEFYLYYKLHELNSNHNLFFGILIPPITSALLYMVLRTRSQMLGFALRMQSNPILGPITNVLAKYSLRTYLSTMLEKVLLLFFMLDIAVLAYEIVYIYVMGLGSHDSIYQTLKLNGHYDYFPIYSIIQDVISAYSILIVFFAYRKGIRTPDTLTLHQPDSDH